MTASDPLMKMSFDLSTEIAAWSIVTAGRVGAMIVPWITILFGSTAKEE